MLSLVELPIETHQILASWQALAATNDLDNEAPTTQTIKDMITLLEMLTMAQDHAPELRQSGAITEELANSEAAIAMLRTELAETKQIAAALSRAPLVAAPIDNNNGKECERTPIPEKFDGSRSKLLNFITQLRLKVASYSNDQAKLRLAVNCLIGDAMDQIRPYVKDERVDVANLAALIEILETAFGNPNRVEEAESKLSSIQQGTRDFALYYAEFQRYAADVQ